MKICITGFSHIAALREALSDGLLQSEKHEFVFIGAASSVYRKYARVVDGVIRVAEPAKQKFLEISGGAYDCVDPNEFDAVVLYGTYSHIQRLVSSILVASPTDNLFFSDAFLYAGARCWLEQQRTIEIVREMRRHSSIPILVVFEPLFSLPYKTELPEGAKLSSKGRAAVHRALTDVVVEAGGVSIFQPEDTLVDNTFTDPEFSLGSKRLGDKGVAHESTDFAHMNGSYGARVLKLILEKLNKTPI